MKKGEKKYIQLNFWEEPQTEYSHVKSEMHLLKESQNNLRRGIFKRYEDLVGELKDLKKEIARIKSELHIDSCEIFKVG